MIHPAKSHNPEDTFAGKDEGIPLTPRATVGPLARALVARTGEGTDQINTLVHDPYGIALTSPSPALPRRGPCAESGTKKNSGVRKDDKINAYQEQFIPGTFPRNVTFPAENIFTLASTPRMPEIPVVCACQGFAPKEIFWRLKVRHVLGRHYSIGKYQYRTICRPLELEWRGKSSATSFNLFARVADDNVSYDPEANDPEETVMGGYALLSIAAYPPGQTAPVVTHAHLRIRGANPSADEVKAFLADVLQDKDRNILLMAQAAFIHESGLKQFDSAEQHRVPFLVNHKRHEQIRKKEIKDKHIPPDTEPDQPDCKLIFVWPYDPPGFPKVAFDFGVGISQFTQLRGQTVTETIAWNWKENVKVGVNVLLRKLALAFAEPKKKKGKKGKKRRAHAGSAAAAETTPAAAAPAETDYPKTWIEWAMRGWRGYNGSQAYADRLRKTAEAEEIASNPEKIDKEPSLALLKAVPLQKTRSTDKPWPR
jgi:hypothetical protein